MLSYTIRRVWDLLEEADELIPWQRSFPGSPHYFTVYEYLRNRGLEKLDPELYSKLKGQVDFNRQYERDHFEELRG